jgi:hypothetical protein
VPPVIVSGQPDDVLSDFMQIIALQFTCSSDVHVGWLRLLQPPDDEMPMPTDWICERAAECDCLQAVAR